MTIQTKHNMYDKYQDFWMVYLSSHPIFIDSKLLNTLKELLKKIKNAHHLLSSYFVIQFLMIRISFKKEYPLVRSKLRPRRNSKSLLVYWFSRWILRGQIAVYLIAILLVFQNWYFRNFCLLFCLKEENLRVHRKYSLHGLRRKVNMKSPLHRSDNLEEN